MCDEHKLGRVVIEGLFILDSEKNLRRVPDTAFVSVERWPLERRLPASGDCTWFLIWPWKSSAPTISLKKLSASCRCLGLRRRPGVGSSAHARACLSLLLPHKDHILSAQEELANTIVPGFRLNLAELFQLAAQ